ncbi:MAG: CapA family protein [Lachnospiraceae bacterium]|jgi:Putative enzyme of poly-gamma-glutamate biosynthesis (capsule formation)|nr:CapA family protein [Lachnospiraceae bacterium]
MGKKKSKRKNNKRKSLGRAFLVTLFVTLSAGASVLFLVTFFGAEEKPEEVREEMPKVAEVEKEDIPEKIVSKEPEPRKAEMTEVSEMPEPAEEDDGFDESGCIRDENGRILVKKQETGNDEAILLFAGDILFDDSYTVMVTMRQRGSIRACFSAETLREMEEADIFMLNNEFTYTNRGEPTPGKAFTFRAKPENAAMLHELGVDIVSLANNHAYDYGEISLLDTLATLEGIDMPYVGAGRNLAEASGIVYFQAGSQKIAFLSGTQIERMTPPDTKGASENTPGVFRCLTETEIFDKIAEAKENSDFVVVYIHWGTEKTDQLDWAQPGMAKSLAQAGADLIIGDHAHVLQPLANVEGVPTIYSLGNYWFNSSTLNTCLVKVTLKDGEMQSFQFLPALQSGCYTKLLSGAEKEAVLEYMRGISGTVAIDAEGYVTF